MRPKVLFFLNKGYEELLLEKQGNRYIIELDEYNTLNSVFMELKEEDLRELALSILSEVGD